MSTCIPLIPRVIPAIRIQVEAQRVAEVYIFPPVLLRESAICAVIISRTQIYRLRLLVEIFSAVAERVVVCVKRIPLAAKRVILIRFEDIPHAVRQQNHVAVCVLVIICLYARCFRVNQSDSAEVHRHRASAHICHDIRPVPHMNRAADAVTQSVRTIGIICIPYIIRYGLLYSIYHIWIYFVNIGYILSIFDFYFCCSTLF